MKLTLKLVLALFVVVFAVAALFGWIRLQRELARFDADIRRDHEVIGATLGGSVAMVWRDDGAERALGLVREADRLKAYVRMRLVWPAPAPGEPGPVVGPSGLSKLRPGGALHVPLRARSEANELVLDENGEEWLASYVGVATPARVGAIEMVESLAAKQSYMRTSLLSVATTSASLAIVTGLLTLALGVWLVGQPMTRLAEKARRVGAGDLSGRLELRQKDEVGELANEMNAMCERLAEADSRLRAEAAARIQALEQLRHADRLMTVGTLAAGIAHELGTPLNVIAGRAKMIARSASNVETTVEYARIIGQQSERMARIIRQLLDYARIRPSKKSKQDLRALADQVLLLVEPLADKRKVRLSLASGAAVRASVDPGQLQQALTNLVVNAIHASPEGATVTVSTEFGQAPPDSPASDSQYAVFRVIDAGCGIAEDALGHIFEPFFTTKPVGEGTGLGLGVTQGIAREHGGFIRVESEPGRGSNFAIYLPVESPT